MVLPLALLLMGAVFALRRFVAAPRPSTSTCPACMSTAPWWG